jgi:hypothetical protein
LIFSFSRFSPSIRVNIIPCSSILGVLDNGSRLKHIDYEIDLKSGLCIKPCFLYPSLHL